MDTLLEAIDVCDVDGFCFGNYTDEEAGTGCTVIVAAEGATGGVDVRGGAPASRETDLLRPDGNVSPDNQTGWAESNWTNLRRVNYMLDNMHKCKGRVSDEIYNHYEGVARFWRAWFYLSLIHI